MFSLVFSFQWNTDLNSFMMQAYVSEKGNNFHPPLPPPPKKKKTQKTRSFQNAPSGGMQRHQIIWRQIKYNWFFYQK